MNPAEYELMYRVEDRLWWYRGMWRITAALLRLHYPPGAGLRILDAGCGTGAAASLLANYGCVTGLDLEPVALRLAQRRGLPRLVNSSVMTLPFAAGSFDLVTCFDVLVMLDEPAEAQALSELARVLAPGGRLLVRVAANDWLRGAHDRSWHVVRRFSQAGLRAGLMRAGLHVERLSHANMWLFPLAVAKRLSERFLPPRDTSDLLYPFGPLDPIFGAILGSEAPLVAGPGLPFGLSLVALARKGL